MPFEKISNPKLSTAVQRQIEDLILRGLLRPGDKLPAERELAETLGVSRPSLREALQALSDAGLLTARQGSGVYVADVLGSAFSPALIGLFAAHQSAVLDSLAFRQDMEGLAVERAAKFGTKEDLAVISAAFDALAASDGEDPEVQAARDADFHMAIVEASHNIVLLHMMRSMYDLLRQGVLYNRERIFDQQTTREALLDQHRAIRDTVCARNAKGARAAVAAHLDFIAETVRAQAAAADHSKVASKRLDAMTKRGA